jgi:hypothetical protein
LVLESLEGRFAPSTVTNFNDSGPGSLRQAIIDTPSGGTVDFQAGLSGTIALMTGGLLINKDLTIAGPGADLIRISGNNASRVFAIDPSMTVSISRLTMADGRVVGTGAQGGGIWNAGTLTVTDSTLRGSSASGYYASGGGIYNTNAGTLTVANSTLSGNSATDPVYSTDGGGIFVSPSATQTTLWNTILAGNTSSSSPDVAGRLNSQGHNLIGDGTGASGFADTDVVGTSGNPIDPLLGPLQDNGGPTKTMALLPGSPAIDAGDNADAPEWDQRGPGYPRITADDPVIDIGAFEVQQGGGGRATSPRARPVYLDVVALVAIPPSQQPVGQIAREAKPGVAAVDAVFANDSSVQPGVVIGRPAVADDLAPLPTHKEIRQDWAQVDDLNSFRALLADENCWA